MLRENKSKDLEYREALRLFEASAKGGNSHAKVSLGEMYEEGVGVRADRNKAAQLYREAIREGETSGKRKLADLLAGKTKPSLMLVSSKPIKVSALKTAAPATAKQQH